MRAYYRHTLEFESTTKVLKKAPAGWKDIERTYLRNDDYHGIFPIDSSPIRFIQSDFKDNSGYQFILDAFNSKGIKAVIKYKRENINRFTNQYELAYTGIMQLSPISGFKHNISSPSYIVARIIDSSKLQSFFANHDKEFRLDTDQAINGNPITPFVNAPFAGTFPKIDIWVYSETTGEMGTTEEGRDFVVNKSEEYAYIYLTAVPDYLDEKLKPSGELTIYENLQSYTINVEVELAGVLSGSIRYDPGTSLINNATMRQKLLLRMNASEYEILEIDDTKNNILSPQTTQFSESFSTKRSYSVPAGGKISFVLEATTTGMDSMNVHLVSNAIISQFDVSEIYAGAPTLQIRPLTWYTNEVLQRSIQVMTGEQDITKLANATIFKRTNSEFQTQGYDGNLSRLGTVGGQAIRATFGKTTISFKKWFQSIDRMGNIALWYDKANDLFRVERKRDAYKRTQILDIGVVSKVSMVPYEKAYFSQILSGTSNDGKYKQIQGVNEYNVQTQHSGDFPVSKKIDLRVPYNTDSLGAEFLKRGSKGEDGLIDTDQDNNVYIYEFNNLDTIIVNDDKSGISGFKGSGLMYNGRFTPKNCLENQGDWLSSTFYRESDGVIQFKSSAKETNLFSRGSYEQDDIIISDISDGGDDTLYFPELIKCESIVFNGLTAQLDSDPHGYVKYTDGDGNIGKAYILKARINEYKGVAKWELIKANPHR